MYLSTLTIFPCSTNHIADKQNYLQITSARDAVRKMLTLIQTHYRHVKQPIMILLQTVFVRAFWSLFAVERYYQI